MNPISKLSTEAMPVATRIIPIFLETSFAALPTTIKTALRKAPSGALWICSPTPQQ